MYEDNTPGEIFIRMAKEGSVVSGLVDAFATATSIMLQYGVPLDVLINKFSHTRFEPSGFTNNPKIPIAKSILDYIFRWLALKFLDKDGIPAVSGLTRTEVTPAAAAALSAPSSSGSSFPLQRAELSPQSSSAPALMLEEAPEKADILTAVAERPSLAQGRLDTGMPGVTHETDIDSPPCPECGSIMIRNGACHKCINCGSTNGCS
jgi:ribonucleoside-diphosphate reductase alpha chain